VPVQVSVSRLRLLGRALGLALVRDITEPKRAAEALRRANEELETRVARRTEELSQANAGLHREIEERQKAEEARAQAQAERDAVERQLQQAHKLEAVGQLAAGIAHEINTPTQFVGDNVRFVQKAFETILQACALQKELLAAAKAGPVPPELVARAEETAAAGQLDFLVKEVPEAVAQTLEGVDRISKIVRAMKEFSHPGLKEMGAADINRAVESTVTVARNEWKYVADMKLELDPELPAVVCYLGEFNQALLNLIINAAHAIGDAVKMNPGTKGAITVRTRQVGQMAEVRVSDTGTGIPEAVRARIFEPFFTTKEIGKGSGQGLSGGIQLHREAPRRLGGFRDRDRPRDDLHPPPALRPARRADDAVRRSGPVPF
jgi:C4-dicarboxylate-specific signal transduction histidine kinase